MDLSIQKRTNIAFCYIAQKILLRQLHSVTEKHLTFSHGHVTL